MTVFSVKGVVFCSLKGFGRYQINLPEVYVQGTGRKPKSTHEFASTMTKGIDDWTDSRMSRDGHVADQHALSELRSMPRPVIESLTSVRGIVVKRLTLGGTTRLTLLV